MPLRRKHAKLVVDGINVFPASADNFFESISCTRDAKPDCVFLQIAPDMAAARFARGFKTNGEGTTIKTYAKGYTQGVFDMFHVGHLNLINNAKKRCEALCVGVNSDRLVLEYKHRAPIIPENERCQIVRNIAAVDSVLIADTLDKMRMHQALGFDVVFVGSDWEGDARWQETENALRAIGVDVVYLPYTRGICSTALRRVKSQSVEE